MESETENSRFDIPVVGIGRKVEEGCFVRCREIRDDHDASDPFHDEQPVGRTRGEVIHTGWSKVSPPSALVKVNPEAGGVDGKRSVVLGTRRPPFSDALDNGK